MLLRNHVCREESLFLYETRVGTGVEQVLKDLVNIHNGRRKILRIIAEVNIPIGDRITTVSKNKILKSNKYKFIDDRDKIDLLKI